MAYVYAPVSMEGVDIGTNTVGVHVQSQTDIESSTVNNTAITIQKSPTSDTRSYNFLRDGSTQPYSVSLLLLSNSQDSFQLTTVGLTDARLYVGGTPASVVKLDNSEIGFTWDNIINNIFIGVGQLVDIFYAGGGTQISGGGVVVKDVITNLKALPEIHQNVKLGTQLDNNIIILQWESKNQAVLTNIDLGEFTDLFVFPSPAFVIGERTSALDFEYKLEHDTILPSQYCDSSALLGTNCANAICCKHSINAITTVVKSGIRAENSATCCTNASASRFANDSNN